MKPTTQRQLSRRKVLLGGAVVAVAASIGAYNYPGTQGDQSLTKEQQQVRLAAFRLAGPVNLALVAPTDRPQAVASMKLGEQPAEVRQAIESGDPLAWLTLWDDLDEDGDTVEVQSHGYLRVVRLTNAPQTIVVPVPEGGIINIRGVYDGGGGITVAIRTGQGQVALPVMAVGQVLGVPVQSQP